MRKLADLLGRSLIAIGALVLLFVVFQLWGTGLLAAQDQRSLKADFRSALATAAHDGPTSPPPALPGDAVALLEIPKIGVDEAVVEGVNVGDLRKGPGHYPGTVLPGQRGNAAIAGHRTTYGAPFFRLDELKTGDTIAVTTLEGRFVYRVDEKLIVTPATVQVLDPTENARLTLTTCNPRYSARQRLVVVASLDDRTSAEPAEPTITQAQTASAIEDLDGGVDYGWDAADLGTLAWALVLGAVGAGWWMMHRGRRHWVVSLAGAFPFLAVLFFFYVEMETLLPANF